MQGKAPQLHVTSRMDGTNQGLRYSQGLHLSCNTTLNPLDCTTSPTPTIDWSSTKTRNVEPQTIELGTLENVRKFSYNRPKVQTSGNENQAMVIKEEPQNITSEARGALASREITEVISERSKLSTVSTQETGIARLESKLSNAKLLPISAIMKTVCQEED